MKNLIIVIVCLAALGGFGWYFYNQQPSKTKNAAKESIGLEADYVIEQQKFIDDFFSTQMKGNTPAGFFCDRNAATTLYAPKEWKVVDKVVEPSSGQYTLRIDSSLQGGISITKLWSVSLKQNGASYCVVSLAEKQAP